MKRERDSGGLRPDDNEHEHKVRVEAGKGKYCESVERCKPGVTMVLGCGAGTCSHQASIPMKKIKSQDRGLGLFFKKKKKK